MTDRTEYMREYMARRRAEERAKRPPSELDQLRTRLTELETAAPAALKAENERLKLENVQLRRQLTETNQPLSKTAQQKLDAAIQRHQRKLEDGFESRVRSEIQRRVQAYVLPSFAQEREDSELLLKARKGVFNQREYNAILRCLHSDLRPTNEQKNEAFRLWHARKIALLSHKDDPRQYPPLPTTEEFMSGLRAKR